MKYITIFALCIAVLFYFTKCSPRNSQNSTVIQNEKILDLSFKICSLKTIESHLSGIKLEAFLEGDSKKELDSLGQLNEKIFNLSSEYLSEFENLIHYENHDTPFTAIHYAQYYYSEHFDERNLKFNKLKKTDSLFIDLEPKKHRRLLTVYSGTDSAEYNYFNEATVIIADKLDIKWQRLTPEEKIELNSIIDAKIMITNYDFFPNTSQTKPRNCGAACLKMICDYYGKFLTLSELEILTKTSTNGASFNDLIRASSFLKLKTQRHKINYQELKELNKLPLIANWNDDHFVVVYKINKDFVWVADPARGLRKYERNTFCKSWMYSWGKIEKVGKAVSFIPKENFYN